ncbi:MAG: mannose-6-phosphate isomerase [Bacteroidetes bacterium CG2_30_33_31]|nr:MAG: mannose-6-phosphate isomerase [Bacteroidetes bacterium CG2_30_33_31]
MNLLLPLKFKPIFKDKIWGGNKIQSDLHYNFDPLPNCGEAWMISGIEGFESVVSEGPLADNTLSELIEVFMGELVGEKVYEQFENEFPLLIKFLDTSQWLSIQVHPDDELAKLRGYERGKTEMWYILNADKDAKLISGFKSKISKAEYVQKLENNTLKEVLNFENVKKGEAFYLPSGRIHAIGPGILLAEIQQSSDITYRIYDWERLDANGNSRELHIDDALDAIDFDLYDKYKLEFPSIENETVSIIDEKYFSTNLMHFHKAVTKDYEEIDSFIIYIITEGSMKMVYEGGEMDLGTGDVVLLPAIMNKVNIFPTPFINLLEVYIK